MSSVCTEEIRPGCSVINFYSFFGGKLLLLDLGHGVLVWYSWTKIQISLKWVSGSHLCGILMQIHSPVVSHSDTSFLTNDNCKCKKYDLIYIVFSLIDALFIPLLV